MSKQKPEIRNTAIISPNDKDAYDRLASLGIQVDPATGEVKAKEGSPFWGGTTDDNQQDGSDYRSPKIVDVSQTEVVLPGGDALGVENETESQHQEEPAATPAPQPKQTPTQTEEGLAKREASAREAQREMSKTQAKLEKTLDEVNRKQAALEAQIKELAAMKALPFKAPELTPADEGAAREFRLELPEYANYVDAQLAPIYAQFASMETRINGVIDQLGGYLSNQKFEQVLNAVYSRVPKHVVDEVTGSEQFASWIGSLPRKIQETYLDIMNKTTDYTAEDAFGVLRHYSQDSGVPIQGLTDKKAPEQPKQTPPKQSPYPNLRSGSALPAVSKPKPSPDAITPLSADELSRFSDLIGPYSGLSDHQRDILKQRLAVTI